MNTGFAGLDKLINLEEPQLILISGTYFIEMLSGDIASNVCLRQDGNVLEVVRCRKEYLIQRICANEANVYYKKWNHENGYTNEELQKIGKTVVNIINGKMLPKIVEQDINLFDSKKIIKLVYDYTNCYGDKEKVNTLVVLDIFPLSKQYKNSKKYESQKLIRNLKSISKKLRCTIIFVYDYDKEIGSKIKKYVDKFIIADINENIDIKEGGYLM